MSASLHGLVVRAALLPPHTRQEQIPLGQDQNIQMPLEALFCLTDSELILLFSLWPYHN